MSLRDEIADAIGAVVDVGGSVYRQADAVIALLREQGDSTWYCKRFVPSDYDPAVCAGYKHEGCGPRLIVDVGVSDV